MTLFYLNEYSTERAYGGGEEGGWWYNIGTYIQTHMAFKSREAADAGYKLLTEAIKSREVGPYKMGVGPLDGVDLAGEPNDAYLTVGGVWGCSKPVIMVEEHPGKNWDDYSPYE
jgi:hypothetical protein